MAITYKTRLNMLFIPTLPVKVEFKSMLRILGNAKNAKQGLGKARRVRGLGMNLTWPIGGGRGDENRFLELPRPMAGS